MSTTQKAINIGIIGAGGRMGRMLIKAVQKAPNAVLTAAIVRTGSSLVGVDAGELVGIGKLGVAISDDLAQVVDKIDVLIDFSLPDATSSSLTLCASHGVPMVIGTTGLSHAQESDIDRLSAAIPIVYAGNYSTGVNLSLDLIATTAKVLGLDADIEIAETHHKHKLDAPSGTALMMAKAAANARGQKLSAVSKHGRDGAAKREVGEIGIHALRGGEIVGEHTVSFFMGNELIEITHKAYDRMAFADGAVRAALWLVGKPAASYDMQDVLGLKSLT